MGPDKKSVCFDAEPLLAYIWDAEGAGVVEDYFVDIIKRHRTGCVSDINLCEVRYRLIQEGQLNQFFHFRQFLENDIGLDVISSDRTWRIASDIKGQHSVALGDAFALATSGLTGTTLIIGADDDYDELDGDMVAIRNNPD